MRARVPGSVSGFLLGRCRETALGLDREDNLLDRVPTPQGHAPDADDREHCGSGHEAISIAAPATHLAF